MKKTFLFTFILTIAFFMRTAEVKAIGLSCDPPASSEYPPGDACYIPPGGGGGGGAPPPQQYGDPSNTLVQAGSNSFSYFINYDGSANSQSNGARNYILAYGTGVGPVREYYAGGTCGSALGQTVDYTLPFFSNVAATADGPVSVPGSYATETYTGGNLSPSEIPDVPSPAGCSAYNHAMTTYRYSYYVYIDVSQLPTGWHTAQTVLIDVGAGPAHPQQGTYSAPFSFYVDHTPPTGHVSVHSNVGTSWTISGPASYSGSGTDGSYSGAPVGDYQIFPSHVYGSSGPSVSPSVVQSDEHKFLSKIIHQVLASSSCSNSYTCTLGGAGDVHWDLSYTPQVCNIFVYGVFNNPTGLLGTKAPYTISGPSSFSAVNDGAYSGQYEYYQAIADPGGTTYTFQSAGASGVTLSNGYLADVNGAYSSQTCYPGSSLYFYLYSFTRPILNVH